MDGHTLIVMVCFVVTIASTLIIVRNNRAIREMHEKEKPPTE